jgi:hypothetical protein
MKSRIKAAWSVLRGTHKAIPMEASWFVGSQPYYSIQPWATTATNVTFTTGGNS